MRHWTHLHTLAAGFVGGLLLDRETLVVAVAGIVAGVALTLGVRYLRASVGFLRSQSERLSQARQEAAHAKATLDLAEAERKRAAAAEHLARAEARLRTKTEQEAAERKAYWAGARDGGRLEPDWVRPETVLGIRTSRA